MIERHNRRWTSEEDADLTLLWMSTPKEEIAKSMGRSVQSIRSRAGALGLRGQHQPSMGPRATKNRIISVIEKNGPMTINDVSGKIEINRAIVHQHILDLERQKRLRRAGFGETPSGRGRAPVLWATP